MKKTNVRAGKLKTEAEILGILRHQFGIEGCFIQILPKDDGTGVLYLIENADVSKRLTMAGLERLARNISRALDGEPYGTINVDFFSLGEGVTFDMAVEARV